MCKSNHRIHWLERLDIIDSIAVFLVFPGFVAVHLSQHRILGAHLQHEDALTSKLSHPVETDSNLSDSFFEK
jgi:hypothetical protein